MIIINYNSIIMKIITIFIIATCICDLQPAICNLHLQPANYTLRAADCHMLRRMIWQI